MNEHPTHRLHRLRMENDAHRYAMDEMRPRFDILRDRHFNGTAPRAVSAYQLFQTPPALAARLVDLLNIQPGARVLEPSAGLGRLLDALPPHQSATAIEVCPDLTRELYAQDRENTTILQRDFLTVSPEDFGDFRFIVMNPPFHLRADIRHTLHALRFLRPGGILAGLCLDTRHREAALRPLSSTWEKIAAGAFRSEGTGVPTVMFSIQA